MDLLREYCDPKRCSPFLRTATMTGVCGCVRESMFRVLRLPKSPLTPWGTCMCISFSPSLRRSLSMSGSLASVWGLCCTLTHSLAHATHPYAHAVHSHAGSFDTCWVKVCANNCSDVALNVGIDNYNNMTRRLISSSPDRLKVVSRSRHVEWRHLAVSG